MVNKTWMCFKKTLKTEVKMRCEKYYKISSRTRMAETFHSKVASHYHVALLIDEYVTEKTIEQLLLK